MNNQSTRTTKAGRGLKPSSKLRSWSRRLDSLDVATWARHNCSTGHHEYRHVPLDSENLEFQGLTKLASLVIVLDSAHKTLSNNIYIYITYIFVWSARIDWEDFQMQELRKASISDKVTLNLAIYHSLEPGHTSARRGCAHAIGKFYSLIYRYLRSETSTRPCIILFLPHIAT